MKGCKNCRYFSIMYVGGDIVGVHCFNGHPITCSTTICPDYQSKDDDSTLITVYKEKLRE